jgi:hypothetical protein
MPPESQLTIATPAASRFVIRTRSEPRAALRAILPPSS